MKHILFIFCIMTFTAIAQQTVLHSNFVFEGKSYKIILEKYNGRAEIWARTKLNMSNSGDVKIADLQTKVVSKDEAMNMICRSKDVYSDIKTVAGCAATIGTGVCVFTGGGGGVGVPVCYAAISYTASGGFVDCVSGLTSKISRFFGASDFGYAVEQSLGGFSVSSLVTTALDEACDDWKRNK